MQTTEEILLKLTSEPSSMKAGLKSVDDELKTTVANAEKHASKFSKTFEELNESPKKSGREIKKMANELSMMGVAAGPVGQAISGLLGVFAAGGGPMLAIGAAVSLLVLVFETFKNKMKEHREATEEATKAIEDHSASLIEKESLLKSSIGGEEKYLKVLRDEIQVQKDLNEIAKKKAHDAAVQEMKDIDDKVKGVNKLLGLMKEANVTSMDQVKFFDIVRKSYDIEGRTIKDLTMEYDHLIHRKQELWDKDQIGFENAEKKLEEGKKANEEWIATVKEISKALSITYDAANSKLNETLKTSGLTFQETGKQIVDLHNIKVKNALADISTAEEIEKKKHQIEYADMLEAQKFSLEKKKLIEEAAKKHIQLSKDEWNQDIELIKKAIDKHIELKQRTDEMAQTIAGPVRDALTTTFNSFSVSLVEGTKNTLTLTSVANSFLEKLIEIAAELLIIKPLMTFLTGGISSGLGFIGSLLGLSSGGSVTAGMRPIMSFAGGGVPSGDDVLAGYKIGERVINATASTANPLAGHMLNQANNGQMDALIEGMGMLINQGGGGNNITIQGNVMSKQFVERDVVSALNNAGRMNNNKSYGVIPK